MASLNALLTEVGIDPVTVQLVRHQQSAPNGNTPYKLWRSNKEEFHNYQNLQLHPKFTRDWVTSFVVAGGSTIFVGLYRNAGRERNSSISKCPITARTFELGSMWIYSLQPDDRLSELSERLIIDWGIGFRTWVQRATKQPKTILEIKGAAHEAAFPGYADFHIQLCELASYPNWVEKLSDVRGVYLLTFDDGQQYVGSATGNGGFWQRWLDYLNNGHGGNVSLKNRDARKANVSILETSRLSDSRDDILSIEYRWQKKLGTRVERLIERDEQSPILKV